MSEEIFILDHEIAVTDLRRLVAAPFGDMVKFVADPGLREPVRELVGELVGNGEPLA